MPKEVFTNDDGKKLLEQLDKNVQERNTLTQSEFMEYQPLFLISSLKEEDADDLKNLATRWQAEVSLFHPVTIVEDNDLSKVLFVLPPMFTTIDQLNRATDRADEVISMFDNAMRSNHPLRTDVEKSLNLLKTCVDSAKNPERINTAINQYSELMDKLNSQAGVETINPETDVDTSVLNDWE